MRTALTGIAAQGPIGQSMGMAKRRRSAPPGSDLALVHARGFAVRKEVSRYPGRMPCTVAPWAPVRFHDAKEQGIECRPLRLRSAVIKRAYFHRRLESVTNHQHISTVIMSAQQDTHTQELLRKKAKADKDAEASQKWADYCAKAGIAFTSGAVGAVPFEGPDYPATSAMGRTALVCLCGTAICIHFRNKAQKKSANLSDSLPETGSYTSNTAFYTVPASAGSTALATIPSGQLEKDKND